MPPEEDEKINNQNFIKGIDVMGAAITILHISMLIDVLPVALKHAFAHEIVRPNMKKENLGFQYHMKHHASRQQPPAIFSALSDKFLVSIKCYEVFII